MGFGPMVRKKGMRNDNTNKAVKTKKRSFLPKMPVIMMPAKDIGAPIKHLQQSLFLETAR